MKAASIVAKPYIVINRMNTRDFKLYILKTLGVASLMALGAVFLVLAATFTSSKKQRIRNGRWELVVNIDRYFPTYNKWLWRISHNDEKDVSQCYFPPRRSGYIPVYHPYRPTGQEGGGGGGWVQDDYNIRFALLAAESAPKFHTAYIVEKVKFEYQLHHH